MGLNKIYKTKVTNYPEVRGLLIIKLQLRLLFIIPIWYTFKDSDGNVKVYTSSAPAESRARKLQGTEYYKAILPIICWLMFIVFITFGIRYILEFLFTKL